MKSTRFNRVAAFSAAAVVAATLAVGVGGVASASIAVSCPPGNNLQTAMTTAPSGSTLMITGTCVGNFTAPAGKTLTLQNGVLDGNASGTVLTVPPGANITLISVTVQNGFTNQDGAGILNRGTLTLKGATVTHNTGGAIKNDATATIASSSIVSNNALNGSGAAVHAGTSTFTEITGGTISDNHTSGQGGAVILQGGATVTVKGTTFSNNSSSQGGAFFLNNSPANQLTVSGSTFTGNHGDDGGVIDNESHVNFTGDSLTSNSAASLGGAIFNESGAVFTLRSSGVSNNTAGGAGGGVFNQGTFSFPGSSISGNTPDNCNGC